MGVNVYTVTKLFFVQRVHIYVLYKFGQNRFRDSDAAKKMGKDQYFKMFLYKH